MQLWILNKKEGGLLSKRGESGMNKKSKKAHAYEEREKSACEWRQRIVRPCTILCPSCAFPFLYLCGIIERSWLKKTFRLKR